MRILAEEDGTGALEEILPRRNFLVRPPIANIDQLFIVSSLRDPYPEPLIVDKTIAVAELEAIQPILVLTKTDLEGPSPLKEAVSYTHLDVYKRQAQATASSAASRKSATSPWPRSGSCPGSSMPFWKTAPLW